MTYTEALRIVLHCANEYMREYEFLDHKVTPKDMVEAISLVEKSAATAARLVSSTPAGV